VIVVKKAIRSMVLHIVQERGEEWVSPSAQKKERGRICELRNPFLLFAELLIEVLQT